jgi:DnaJ-class molecular chaperone
MTHNRKSWHTCPTCNGTGRLLVTFSLYGVSRLVECPRCAGSGRIP